MKGPRRFAACCLTIATVVALAACDEPQQKPSESNTYNVYLYHGKNVSEQKYLGQVVGISRCQTAVHTEAAKMKLKGHSYSYACCWVNAGEACYQKHK